VIKLFISHFKDNELSEKFVEAKLKIIATEIILELLKIKVLWLCLSSSERERRP